MGRDAWAEPDLHAATRDDGDPAILAELAPGERLAWAGQPRPARLILPTLPLALFGVAFAGFGVFWTGSVNRLDGGAFALFGLPFALAGAAMALSPFWFAWAATQTRYAVTDRRVFLLEPRLGLGVQVRSYEPAALGRIVRTRRGDGSGDLIFEEIRTVDREGHARTTRRGFKGIEDVRRVEDLIRSTLLAGRS